MRPLATALLTVAGLVVSAAVSIPQVSTQPTATGSQPASDTAPALDAGGNAPDPNRGPAGHSPGTPEPSDEQEEDPEDGLKVETPDAHRTGDLRVQPNTTRHAPGGVRANVYRPPRA